MVLPNTSCKYLSCHPPPSVAQRCPKPPVPPDVTEKPMPSLLLRFQPARQSQPPPSRPAAALRLSPSLPQQSGRSDKAARPGDPGLTPSLSRLPGPPRRPHSHLPPRRGTGGRGAAGPAWGRGATCWQTGALPHAAGCSLPERRNLAGERRETPVWFRDCEKNAEGF